MQPLPQNAAVLVFGFSNVNSAFGPLPLDLTAFGMPGCFGRVSLDVPALVLGAGGSASYPLVIPSQPALAGTIVHGQAIVFDANDHRCPDAVRTLIGRALLAAQLAAVVQAHVNWADRSTSPECNGGRLGSRPRDLIGLRAYCFDTFT